MTINEFRAWLDGLKEGIGEAPTAEQWAKVAQKLGEVHEQPPIAVPSLPCAPLDLGPGWWRQQPVWCGPNTSTTSAKPFIHFGQITADVVTLAKLAN